MSLIGDLIIGLDQFHLTRRLGSEMAVDILELARRARGGWATSSGTPEELKTSASRVGWEIVPNRPGEPVEQVLLPKQQSDAPPRSLSKIYGMGAQPLHTDGAHLTRPPDFVALWSAEPNLTSTFVWSVRHASVKIPYFDLKSGLFLVNSGPRQFLAHAYEGDTFRYDPGCMTPSDARAKIGAEYFRTAIADAHQHQWTQQNMLLIIDNRRALHARGAIEDGDRHSRQLVRLAFHTEAS